MKSELKYNEQCVCKQYVDPLRSVAWWPPTYGLLGFLSILYKEIIKVWVIIFYPTHLEICCSSLHLRT